MYNIILHMIYFHFYKYIYSIIYFVLNKYIIKTAQISQLEAEIKKSRETLQRSNAALRHWPGL